MVVSIRRSKRGFIRLKGVQTLEEPAITQMERLVTCKRESGWGTSGEGCGSYRHIFLSLLASDKARPLKLFGGLFVRRVIPETLVQVFQYHLCFQNLVVRIVPHAPTSELDPPRLDVSLSL